MDLFGHSIIQGLMGLGGIVKWKIRHQPSFKIPLVPIILKLTMFIFNRAPQSFDKGGVKDRAAPIYTGLDPRTALSLFVKDALVN